MSLRSVVAQCVPMLAGVVVVACAGDPAGVESVARPQAAVGTGPTPLCQVGCVETDPNPQAPGVFLGSGVTPEVCFTGSQSDADQDRLGDFCEKNLAAAFAPELRYYQFDNVGREPHWVARPTLNETVIIGYLPSYYRDEGSNSFWCRQQPFTHWSCFGHNGDSEAIFLEVYFDWVSQHWLLHEALYSQHGSYGVYSRGSNAYPTQLYYPGQPGSYPRAWVSEGKHANYATRRECNSGGTFGSDTCEQVNVSARVEAGGSLNVGSRAVHSAAQDCMTSSNPSYEYFGSGAIECCWTDLGAFRGWIPEYIGGASSQSYGPILQVRGF